ncbi:MAG TPA: hypothetical protein VFY39_07300, partial [Gammaproteobacteria bacterium]|nr:hypothetical protein [Gammaproteobacteria bacterium]
MRPILSRLALTAGLASAALASAQLRAQPPSPHSDLLARPPVRELGAITLEQALEEAHRANAKLPVAQFKVQQS